MGLGWPRRRSWRPASRACAANTARAQRVHLVRADAELARHRLGVDGDPDRRRQRHEVGGLGVEVGRQLARVDQGAVVVERRVEVGQRPVAGVAVESQERGEGEGARLGDGVEHAETAGDEPVGGGLGHGLLEPAGLAGQRGAQQLLAGAEPVVDVRRRDADVVGHLAQVEPGQDAFRHELVEGGVHERVGGGPLAGGGVAAGRAHERQRGTRADRDGQPVACLLTNL